MEVHHLPNGADQVSEPTPDPKEAFMASLQALKTNAQRDYVMARIDGLNKSDAARQAGYSARYPGHVGARLEKRADVQLAIQAGLVLRRVETEVDLGTIDRSENVRVLAEIRDDPTAKPADRIKAVQELNRMEGLHQAPQGGSNQDKEPVRLAIISVPAPQIEYEVDDQGRRLPIVPKGPVIEHEPR